MRFAQTTKVTIAGIKIAEVEVTKEFAENRSTPERRRGSIPGITPINPNFVIPLLAEAVGRMAPLAPEKFSFENGQDLVVDGNISAYSSVQELKKMFYFDGIIKIVFEVAALTNAYDKQNAGFSGVFLRNILNVVRENWDEQKIVVS